MISLSCLGISFFMVVLSYNVCFVFFFFFSSRRRHTRCSRDWSSDVCSSDLTRERRVMLILDEIQCGLGRTGSFFAYEDIGIEPDMLTVAKPLANGLPMGAKIGRASCRERV